MNEEQQLKLQAYLDGELPESEMRDVAALVQGNRDAAALLAELKGMRELMAEAEVRVVVPETRAFYWSQIERAIRKGDGSSRVPSRFEWRHLLWPVGAMALCFLVVVLGNPITAPEPAVAISIDADMPIVEAVQPDSDATAYRNEADGTTLVWFSTEEKPGQNRPSTVTF
jgi:anti-sigma factor RsiW